MRSTTCIIFGVSFFCLAGRAEAQTSTKASVPVPASVRAAELHTRAVELHADPSRAFEAARLHIAAAQLRTPSDPEGVHDLALAAHMYSYAKRPLEAKRTMERAAERALAMGDVLRAAQAYVDATFMADIQQNRVEVTRLGRRALLLAGSPLLDSQQQSAITRRLRGNQNIAALIW